jgi:hypothetical protein
MAVSPRGAAAALRRNCWLTFGRTSHTQLFRQPALRDRCHLPNSSCQDLMPDPYPLPSPKTETPAPTKSPAAEVPELSELDQVFKQTSLGKAADEYRTRIEWRKLQNEAVNDPDVVAAKAAANSARTDLEKRERLRDYYEIYYGKMRARASNAEMKAAIDRFKTEHLRLLSQPRVRPNSDLPKETPTPTKRQHRR